MLKKRIIPTLLYKNMTLVKGVSFDSWRSVGSVMQAVKVYNMREVDELIFLDITATIEHRRPYFELVDEFADECFMPLTVGGGIRNVEDIGNLLKVGADKVSINTSSVNDYELIKQSAKIYGSQCIVVSIDAKKNKSGQYEIYTKSGTVSMGIDPFEHATRMEELGAGEILITSVNSDGKMEGYDMELIQKIAKKVNIPVIASGGAGSYKDILDVLKINGVDAAAAASIFHFTELTPKSVKFFLKENGINVRL
jgi:imidazole glycerol-phosphate synthase subunit HisF